MRLKRLIVHGFKSFADKTEFNFDSDLTGIVGPNGCGKSNVVDALKWVLGDQRAKSLRGTEMTDVIFKGAEGRPSMGAAEVAIVLDDPAGRLDGRTEVTIGRRLTTEKESDYSLNGQVGRLKDVRDLLLDTGLGVGAYSVMEQGRIDAVLSADPEERRSIFEEAAGISRFKMQKRETLRKLERTEQNLARVHDLLEERERRIRSLKIQAGKARRWLEIQAQLRDLKAALAVLQARGLRTQQRAASEDLAAQGARLQALEAVRREITARLQACEQAIEQCSREVEEVAGRAARVDSDRRSADERAESQQHRAAELFADAEQAGMRAQELAQQTQERTLQIEEARTKLAELEAGIVALHDALSAQREVVATHQQRARELTEGREAARERVMEWMRVRTHKRNQAHDQEAQKRALDARAERLGQRSHAVAEELDSLTQQRLQQAIVLQDLEARGNGLVLAEQQVLQELAAADQEAAELARRVAEGRERLSAVTSRLELLADMEAHMEGLDQGPRYLLGEQPAGLLGKLSDLLDIEVEYGPALEAALGPFVQALVVDTRAHADAMLALLEQHKKGRAILLVREEFAAELPSAAALELPAGARFLAELVRCPESARAVVHWLLRGACLVESLAAATADRPDLMFVTRNGSLSCGPRLEGGHGEAQGGLVVRRAQAQRLGQERDALAGGLAALQTDSDRAQARLLALKERVRLLGQDLAAAREQRQEAGALDAQLAARGQDLARELATLTAEGQEVAAARLSALAALGTHLTNAHLAERCERAEIAREAELAAGLQEAAAAVQEAQHREHELRVRQAACTTDRDGVVNAIRMHDAALVEIGRNRTEQEQRGREARAQAEKALTEASRCQEQSALLREELSALGAERDERDQQLQGARARQTEERQALQTADGDRETLTEQVTQVRLVLSELEHKFLWIEDHLRDETRVEVLRCLDEIDGFGLATHAEIGPVAPAELVLVLSGPPLPPEALQPELELARLWLEPGFDAAKAATDVQLLESQRERLGAVNLEATRELAQEERDFSQLEHEVADLSAARKSLIETLRKMEQESRALFEATFEQARANFKTIFRKLFQGGHADMYLTAPKRDETVPETASSFDALECGIEIVAKPPGKELQSIRLLSGGERSLTALAILFAVFKVKPSPFCILDEVDAALDETNVERFLRVLADFVGPTQFCIVTHHKRTMAACQVLYGISMQKKGVSSRIAVSLAQVDELHAGNVVRLEPEAALAVHTADDPTKQRIAGEEPIGF